MTTEVKYKFSIDQKVKTDLDEKGIVDAMMTDSAGSSYLVRTTGRYDWLRESTLSVDPSDD